MCALSVFYIMNHTPCSEVLLSLIAGLRTAVSEACETIQMTCEDNVWLSDVWKFVRSWQGRSKVTSMSAEELEVSVNQLLHVHQYVK